MVDSSYHISTVTDRVLDNAGFNWITGPIPTLMDEPVQNIFGASVSIPASDPENELAAWIFVKYISSPDVQAKWVQNSKYLPVRISAVDYFEGLFLNDQNYLTAVDLMKFGITEPSLPGYDLVHKELELAIGAIYTDTEIIGVLNSLTAVSNSILALQLEK